MACRTAPMDPTCLPEMPRRAFLAIVAGGLLAAPLAAEAQQPGKVFRVGFLTPDDLHPDGGREGRASHVVWAQ